MAPAGGPRSLFMLAVGVTLVILAAMREHATEAHGGGHGHAHDHGGHGHAHGNAEPASFKYSRAANEPVAKEAAHGGHGHAHDAGHAHEAGHGHAHNAGHGHAHDAGHGHTHGGHGHSHDTEDDHHGHGPNPQQHARIDRGHAHEAGQDPAEAARLMSSDTGLWLWCKALGSTALVSAAPVVILLLIPLENAHEQRPLLKILLSFASGGLLGDAFLHLIPHAISPHSHSDDGHGHTHGHSHSVAGEGHLMRVGLWVLFGIVAFLGVEKFVRYVKGSHSHGHEHSHSSAAPDGSKQEKKKKKDGSDEKKETTKDAKKADDQTKASESTVTDKKTDEVCTSKDMPAGEGDIKVAGYLNLAADFAHNFTDGLAIGASYAAGHYVGLITTVTILLHEVPHEVGDFAILIQSGCSKRKAMMLQFSTAIGAMLGTVCSLIAEGIGDIATAWILPFTAGGFIYIATVSVIPELLEDSKVWQSIKEIAALLIGIVMMVIIAMCE